MSGMPAYGLDGEYPLLWDASKRADALERLGLDAVELDAQIARAMYELWLARSNLSASSSAARGESERAT